MITPKCISASVAISCKFRLNNIITWILFLYDIIIIIECTCGFRKTLRLAEPAAPRFAFILLCTKTSDLCAPPPPPHPGSENIINQCQSIYWSDLSMTTQKELCSSCQRRRAEQLPDTSITVTRELLCY